MEVYRLEALAENSFLMLNNIVLICSIMEAVKTDDKLKKPVPIVYMIGNARRIRAISGISDGSCKRLLIFCRWSGGLSVGMNKGNCG